jgi:hypothetical protein
VTLQKFEMTEMQLDLISGSFNQDDKIILHASSLVSLLSELHKIAGYSTENKHGNKLPHL